MGGVWTTPWVRRRLSPTDRATLRALVPDGALLRLLADSPGGPFLATITSADGRYDHFRDRVTSSSPATAALRLLADVGIRCLCRMRAVRIGPYWICRSLTCPHLVVGTTTKERAAA
jgi:hypothetical protein